jgi:D-alanyl-lipoteichoic acid acyltransferase DltB (MBOAT superfamily)
MLFNSYSFLVFFPAVALLYFVLPHKIRWIWLLVASYFFYMSWNPKYAVLLSTSILITWTSGLLIDWSDKKNTASGRKEKKVYVALSFILNLAILGFFKYFNFFTGTAEYIIERLPFNGITFAEPRFDILLPVGISFYTFQALSYTMDIYRGEIYAEKNLAKYALFVSFFPQLVAGPIERSKNLLTQISERHNFDWERIKNGLLLMLWGYFEKLVIADRVAILVNTVFDNYQNYTGYPVIIAVVFFAIQVYGDFAGYTHIAIGAAECMGFRLMKNFNQPYFAVNIKDFWRRWHISLSTWFRDYLYIPLGGSRCSKIRHQFNIMITFVMSGLWHGAAWHYVFWGALHGIYHVIGEITAPIKATAMRALKIKQNTFWDRLLQIIITFIIVDIAWVFFRAENVGVAFSMLKSMAQGSLPRLNELLSAGIGPNLHRTNSCIAVFSILVLVMADWFHYRNPRFSFRAVLAGQHIVIRWGVYIAAIMFVLVCGVYGPDHDETKFIYFQF